MIRSRLISSTSGSNERTPETPGKSPLNEKKKQQQRNKTKQNKKKKTTTTTTIIIISLVSTISNAKDNFMYLVHNT